MQLKLAGAHVRQAHFPVSDLGRGKPLVVDARFHHLSKVHLLVARHDVGRADVADHARYAAEPRGGAGVCHQHIHQLAFAVGAPRAVGVMAAEPRSLNQHARVELHLVGLEGPIGCQAQVIFLVGFGGGAQQVHHGVHVRLESEQAQQLEGALYLGVRGVAVVRQADALIQALDSHLHLGAAQAPQGKKVSGHDSLGARFHHQTHHAVGGLLVGAVLCFELFPGSALPAGCFLPSGVRSVETVEGLVVGAYPLVHLALRGSCLRGKLCRVAGYPGLPIALTDARYVGLARHAVVQGAEQLADEPDLVLHGVVAPGAAQNDELHLVGYVPHFGKGLQAGLHLQVRVEAAALGPLAGRLVGQVALRHAQVVGAVQAFAAALPWLGEHGDGCHARSGAAGLHLQGALQAALLFGAKPPGGPALWLVLSHIKVVGHKAALRKRACVGVPLALTCVAVSFCLFKQAFIVAVDHLGKLAFAQLLAGFQLLEYVEERLFHGCDYSVRFCPFPRGGKGRLRVSW